MTGPAVGDLDQMLAQMQPELRSGAYVFVTIKGPPPPEVTPIMTFAEDEGLTLIVAQDAADTAGLPYEIATAWITLTVHSSLAGVGLTAAFSTALADAGISCNVVAAAFHDHLFVPVDLGPTAIGVLQQLSATHPATGSST
jgi:hypothetical protein